MGARINLLQIPETEDIKIIKQYLVSQSLELNRWFNIISSHKHTGLLNDFDSIIAGTLPFTNTVTGLTWNGGTSTLSLTATYVIPTTTEETNWNTAYGWGSHAGLYLKLDQTAPQAFSGGTVSGSGLLKVTSGTLGLDSNTYYKSGDSPSFNTITLMSGADTGGTIAYGGSPGYIYITAGSLLSLAATAVYSTAGFFEVADFRIRDSSITYYTQFLGQSQSGNLTYSLPTDYPVTVSKWLKCTTGGIWSWSNPAQSDITGLTTSDTPLFANLIATKVYLGTTVGDPYITSGAGKISGSVNFNGTFEGTFLGDLSTLGGDVNLSNMPSYTASGKLYFSRYDYFVEEYSLGVEQSVIDMYVTSLRFTKGASNIYGGSLGTFTINNGVNGKVEFATTGTITFTTAGGLYTRIDALQVGTSSGVMYATSGVTGPISYATLKSGAGYYTSGDSPSFATVTATGLTVNGVDILPNGWNSISEALTYDNADDDPTYRMTAATDVTSKYSVGMKIMLTNTTVKYFIITKIDYNVTNASKTTFFLYGGTDYNLVNAAISSQYYSTQRSPFGFPLDPTKWEVLVTDTSDRSQATATTGTWYNVGTTNSQIVIPIGSWDFMYSVVISSAPTGGNTTDFHVTLSTANNSEADTYWSSRMYSSIGGSQLIQCITKSGIINTTVKATEYLNAQNANGADTPTLYFVGTAGKTTLRARCAYL